MITMISLNLRAWRPALLRQFCSGKTKQTVTHKESAKNLFDDIYDKKVTVDEQVHNHYHRIKEQLQIQLNSKGIATRISATKAGYVFSSFLDKNYFNREHSLVLLTFILSLVKLEPNENMGSLYKGLLLEADTWFQKNLPIKLDVLIMLIEHSPAEVTNELVSSLDESLANVLTNKNEELNAFEAIGVAMKIYQLNQTLKENKKQELHKSIPEIVNLRAIYQEKLDLALTGKDLEAMVHTLELLQYTDSDLSNTKIIIDHLEDYFTKDESASISIELLTKVAQIQVALLWTFKIETRESNLT